MKASSIGCLVIASLATFACVSSDSFDVADLNHDGSLSRAEYESFAQQVHSELSKLLAVRSGQLDSSEYHRSFSQSENSFFNNAKSFWGAFAHSFLMILVTEAGDKTFFIAAVLAMRQDRWAVYIGALGALAAMTVLSSIMGFALPSLLPRQYTHYASALLFVYFGIKLLKDASEMEGGGPSEELQEVEEELIHKKEGDDSAENAERGQISERRPAISVAVTRTLTQSFTLTFLAEWGDRSQIATIAMAAAKDPFGVTTGGIIGHALCTGVAVVGGRMLASKISEKTVSIIGGILFLGFAVQAIIFPDF